MGLVDSMLDRSVFWSFDRSGYERHQRRFEPSDLRRSMKGKTCLVTGANSGLGLEVARGLAEREATVHLLCRNEARGAAAEAELRRDTNNPAVYLEQVDLSNLASIRSFVEGFGSSRVDVLVHNAGLLPLEREITDDGLELAVATHLVGPHLLTKLSRSRLRHGRVVFVSSGGMYAKRLDVDDLLSHQGPYDGVHAYAMTKRGQVVLSELWARELAGSGTTANAMHPGWAATPGVERSLPRFWQAMQKRLRSPAQGADTALWLCVADRVAGESGQLWFDRRSVPTHMVWWTRESNEQRSRLWTLCDARTGT